MDGTANTEVHCRLLPSTTDGGFSCSGQNQVRLASSRWSLTSAATSGPAHGDGERFGGRVCDWLYAGYDATVVVWMCEGAEGQAGGDGWVGVWEGVANNVMQRKQMGRDEDVQLALSAWLIPHTTSPSAPLPLLATPSPSLSESTDMSDLAERKVHTTNARDMRRLTQVIQQRAEAAMGRCAGHLVVRLGVLHRDAGEEMALESVLHLVVVDGLRAQDVRAVECIADEMEDDSGSALSPFVRHPSQLTIVPFVPSSPPPSALPLYRRFLSAMEQVTSLAHRCPSHPILSTHLPALARRWTKLSAVDTDIDTWRSAVLPARHSPAAAAAAADVVDLPHTPSRVTDTEPLRRSWTTDDLPEESSPLPLHRQAVLIRNIEQGAVTTRPTSSFESLYQDAQRVQTLYERLQRAVQERRRPSPSMPASFRSAPPLTGSPLIDQPHVVAREDEQQGEGGEHGVCLEDSLDGVLPPPPPGLSDAAVAALNRIRNMAFGGDGVRAIKGSDEEGGCQNTQRVPSPSQPPFPSLLHGDDHWDTSALAAPLSPPTQPAYGGRPTATDEEIPAMATPRPEETELEALRRENEALRRENEMLRLDVREGEAQRAVEADCAELESVRWRGHLRELAKSSGIEHVAEIYEAEIARLSDKCQALEKRTHQLLTLHLLSHLQQKELPPSPSPAAHLSPSKPPSQRASPIKRTFLPPPSPGGALRSPRGVVVVRSPPTRTYGLGWLGSEWRQLIKDLEAAHAENEELRQRVRFYLSQERYVKESRRRVSSVSHQLQDKQREVTALQSCVSEQSQQMKDNLRHTQHLKDQLQASEQRVLKMAEEISSLRAALANPPPTLAKQDAILTKFLQPAPKASVAQKACRVHFDRLQEELTTHPRAPAAAAAAAAAADTRQPMRLIAAYERCRQQTEEALAAFVETEQAFRSAIRLLREQAKAELEDHHTHTRPPAGGMVDSVADGGTATFGAGRKNASAAAAAAVTGGSVRERERERERVVNYDGSVTFRGGWKYWAPP
ncbi:unnamed protein product [Vitrella brassicaformis CCMP3155]|uniref:Uncharacterized protein n=3 Tax=Vitrella brassicaformis TaxID=1169539 RepID=A0A0G4EYX1_VITBC|nr:unnamed protein product [Vitrella brassicaformis CCMP3155]|eukprot:CEM03730.1 unnamed protein product [Vitrella brassicaformis CCMP3155]